MAKPRTKTALGWLPGVAEHLAYYVYLLIDPRDDKIFYVGKGVRTRCFSHIREARKRTDRSATRTFARLDTIRAIERHGLAVRIEILRHGLTEAEAEMLESAVIDLFGLDALANKVAGYGAAERGLMGTADLNALYGSRPAVFGTERIVLIRVARQFHLRIPDHELYEATRRWWRVGAIRRDLGSPRAPEYAMALYGGVVRAVYRIEGWEPATARAGARKEVVGRRWGFWGHRDRAMERLFCPSASPRC